MELELSPHIHVFVLISCLVVIHHLISLCSLPGPRVACKDLDLVMSFINEHNLDDNHELIHTAVCFVWLYEKRKSSFIFKV